jgi:flagellar P-ring protein precursor FlgI
MGSLAVTRTLKFTLAVATAVLALWAAPAAHAASRIKDLANIEGVRQNQLIGYGLVVGSSAWASTSAASSCAPATWRPSW